MKRSTFGLSLLLGLLVPTTAFAQARAPYLQRTTPSETTVVWRDTSPTPNGVCVGTAPTALTRFVGTSASSTDHEVVVDGLTPATRYFYVARRTSCPAGTSGSAEDTFVTAPSRTSMAPVRFWLVGDSGTGGSEQAAVRDAALAATGTRPFDFAIHVGDMAYTSGTTSEFDDHYCAMYQGILRSTTMFPAIGNHEGSSSFSATQTGPYYEAYVTPTDGRAGGVPSGTAAYYAFDWGPLHVVVLDSHHSPRAVDGPMLRWLETAPSATAATWIIAVWHHPPYSDTSHNSDTETQLIQMRENAVPILDRHGVDLVLTGHSHGYERSFLLRGAYDTPSTTHGIVDPGDGRLDGDGAHEPRARGAPHVVPGPGAAGLNMT